MKLLLSLMYRAAIPACALRALLIVYPHALYAATATSGCGTIAADTVWPADHVYVIDGCDLTIEAGATLTIQPGTVVKSWIERGLTVQGVLSAQGTGDNPIIFT
ncbi:MAG: T9SS C-terminal target domain-containing protein, partial [Candidatus Binatia bacterium]